MLKVSRKIRQEVKEYILDSLRQNPLDFSLHIGGGAEIDGKDSYYHYRLLFRAYENTRQTIVLSPSSAQNRKTSAYIEEAQMEPGTTRVHFFESGTSFGLRMGNDLLGRIERPRYKATQILLS